MVCVLQFSDNRKINFNLEPKPAVAAERLPKAQNARHGSYKIRKFNH
jgi:hypothetical protein